MGVRGSVAWLTFVATCVGGCDGGPGSDTPRPDGSVLDAAVTPALIPWLGDGAPPIAPPELTPCPEGWREVTFETGPAICEPYPEGGALDCPAGQAHFPGESGCVPVGSPCPGGDFSDVLPADRAVVYVQPGATGGDGMSPTRPYGSLTEFSINGLPTGSVIALSRGTHVGPARLTRGVALWGACAAETILTTAEASASDGVVTIRNARGEVHELTVADSPRGGVLLSGDSSEAVLEGVVVRGVEAVGVRAEGSARLTARTVVVRDTRGRSGDRGLGRGLVVGGGATADISRTLLQQNRLFGVYAEDPGTSVALADVVVRDTQSQESDGTFGRGIHLQDGAAAEVSRALVERNHDIGVYARFPETTVRLTDLVIRDTESDEVDGLGGSGVDVEDGATAEVSRVLLEHNRDVGVYAGGADATVTLADVVIRDTQGRRSDGRFGRGLNVELGATAHVTRALLERNREIAVFSVTAGTSLTLADVILRDTLGQDSDERGGRALGVQTGATAEVSRALLEHNRDLGFFASGMDTEMTLTDVVVRDVQSEQRSEMSGRGLNVQDGATAEVTRALLDQTRDLGVYVSDAGTTLALADAVVRDTRVRACAETTCAGFPAGHGVGSHEDGALSMTRFVVESADTCGVLVARDGQVDLSVGEIRGHAIGVCLQVEGYDIDRLTDRVLLTDNDANLQSTSLPVPEPAAPVPTSP